MLLETSLLTFLTVYDAKIATVIFTASIASLYTSLLTGFAAIRNLQIVKERFWLVLTAMAAVGVPSVGAICLLDLYATKHIVVSVGVMFNTVLGFIASFAYGNCKRWEIISFWIITGLILDAAAMQLNVRVCFDLMHFKG